MTGPKQLLNRNPARGVSGHAKLPMSGAVSLAMGSSQRPLTAGFHESSRGARGGLTAGRIDRVGVPCNNDVQAGRRCVREEAVSVAIQRLESDEVVAVAQTWRDDAPEAHEKQLRSEAPAGRH